MPAPACADHAVLRCAGTGNPYSVHALSTRIRLRVASSGTRAKLNGAAGGSHESKVWSPTVTSPISCRRRLVRARRRRGRSGARRDGAERQVRPRDQGRRRARPEPVAARQARHRHPLRRDRGGRGRHPGRRARCACSTPRGKLVTPGLIDLHCARLSRTARRSAFRPTSSCRSSAPPPACRRAMPAPTTSPRFRRYIVGADAHAPLCVRAHRQHRPRRLPGGRALQHRLRAGRRRAPRRWPRTPTSRSASRCACRRT